MNKHEQTLLINFHNHGVTRTHVSFFGRELDIPTARVTACGRMLASFGSQQLLRQQPSIFGRSIQQLVSNIKSQQTVDLAALVNASTAHLDLEPELEPVLAK